MTKDTLQNIPLGGDVVTSVKETTVDVSADYTSGSETVRIATISVDGNPTSIYAPKGGTGGSTVTITDTLSALAEDKRQSIAKVKIDSADPIDFWMRNDYVTTADMPLTFESDEAAISVTNAKTIVFPTQGIETNSFTVDTEKGAMLMAGGGMAESANIKVDGNYYTFGNSFYGNTFKPNSEIVSSDLYKVFKDEDDTISTDIIADRRWTKAYLDSKLTAFDGKSIKLSDYSLKNALSLLFEALGAKVSE